MAKFDNPDDIKVILATDCGSTTTKAILIEYVNGEYRLISRGEAPTTVEAPISKLFFSRILFGWMRSSQKIRSGPMSSYRLRPLVADCR